MKIKLALIAATLFAANAASATDIYAGVGVGQSKLKGDVADYVNRTGAVSDDKDTTGKVFLGAQFNPYFGLEATYAYLGNYKAHDRFNYAGVQARSLGLDAVVTLPLTQKFGVLGRVGYAHVDGDAHLNGRDFSGNTNDPHYGLGLQYKLNDNWALRGEVERQRVKYINTKNNVDTGSVSLVYTFGRKAPTVVKTTYVETAPAPVYTAPAPAPVVEQPAPAPEPVVTKKKVRE